MLGLRSSSWHGFKRKAQYLGPIVTAGMSSKVAVALVTLELSPLSKEMDFD